MSAADPAPPRGFAAAPVPPILMRPGGLAEIGPFAAGHAAGGTALLVVDARLARGPAGEAARAALEAAGMRVLVFDRVAGEPGLDTLAAATALAARAEVAIGLGGGSALDTAKAAAALARAEAPPAAHACAARPLPAEGLPCALVPTTAGTGAESSSTAIFSDAEGRKLWLWGAALKPALVILDPALTVSKPAVLTAACGMDAFVHAFEAATNRHAHPGAALYAHAALARIAHALPRAVAAPGDLGLRGDLLLAACHAGTAIDNCGTAVAHALSHALAALAPVGHGLATALAFEETLPWLVEADTAEMGEAARALGLAEAAALPGFVSALHDRIALPRRLPAAFRGVTAEALAAAVLAPENAPMREATVRPLGDAEARRFAARLLARAEAGTPLGV